MRVRPSGQPFYQWIPGEIEAARSLGMTNRQVYRRIIIPQCSSRCNSYFNQLSH